MSKKWIGILAGVLAGCVLAGIGVTIGIRQMEKPENVLEAAVQGEGIPGENSSTGNLKEDILSEDGKHISSVTLEEEKIEFKTEGAENDAKGEETGDPVSLPTPTPEPTPAPTASPEPTPAPTQTPLPTPEPTPTPIPEPTPTPFVCPKPAGLSWPSGAYDDGQIYVMLDAGHGGTDVGTMTKNQSVYEKDINLKVVLWMKPLLEEKGINVVLTRGGDDTVSLQSRADSCNELDIDAFVSIHVNSYDKSSKIGGMECYFYPGSVPCSTLAQDIFSYAKQSGIVTRSVLAQDYFVLKHTDCTAVLVEIGYLTNPADAANLLDDEYLQSLAGILAEAIASSVGKGA